MLVPPPQYRPEVGMLLLAAILLAAGVLFYALDRGGSLYFLSGWIAAPPSPAEFLGPLGNHLPTFLHTLAFVLITAAILRPWPQFLLPICATWFGIECLFEVGQMAPFDSHIGALLPGWFEGVPVLEIASDYFIRGTYDALDVVSIALGTTIAYPLVRLFLQGDKL